MKRRRIAVGVRGTVHARSRGAAPKGRVQVQVQRIELLPSLGARVSPETGCRREKKSVTERNGAKRAVSGQKRQAGAGGGAVRISE